MQVQRAKVLVVAPPGELESALRLHLEAGEAETFGSPDGIHALGRAAEIGPSAVIVDSGIGAPGAAVVCRILRKRLPASSLHVLVDTVAEGATEQLSRASGPHAIAEAVLGKTVPEPVPGAEQRAGEGARPGVGAARPSGEAPFDRVERLVEQGRWAEIRDALRPPEGEGELSPKVGLLYAVACKETAADHAPAADALAIKSVQALLDLPGGSPTALVVAKRLLRRNPVAWGKSQPPPRTSLAVLTIVLLFAGAVGWLVSRWLF